MDHGIPIVKSMKNMVRILAYPEYAKTKCPLCNTDELNQHLLEHLTEHTKTKGTLNTLLDSINAVGREECRGTLFLSSIS